MSTIKSIALTLAVTFAGTVSPGARAGEEGAKGLFVTQLERPGQAMNTGVQYWIELHRNGRVWRVNNRVPFRSGDRIRFHVRPNITGFAYILLKSGSRGEQSLLFPDPARGDDNHVAAGQDYALPADSYLAFDENPGTEKVGLLISRQPVDAAAYLSTPDTEKTLIACASTGSKDLIPSRIVLAFSPPAQPAPIAAEHPAPPPRASAPAKPASHKAATAAGSTRKAGLRARAGPAKARPRQPDAGVVTVVKTDPGGVLTVDVALEHR